MATLALRNRPLGAPLQGPGAVVGARDGAAQAGGAALLQVDAVSLEYHTPGRVVRATHRVGFDVFASERFVLLGPSGCGKSTLLKAVAGFIDPVEGEIRLDGQRVRGPGPDRIVVFQEFDQLPPWKTVRENVMFPLLASHTLGRKEAEALSYMTSEVHAAYGGHFGPKNLAETPQAQEEVKRKTYETLAGHYQRMNEILGRNGGHWYLGERTFADAFLYVLERWIDQTPLSIADYPALQQHRARMEADKGVQLALKRQGMEPIGQ